MSPRWLEWQRMMLARRGLTGARWTGTPLTRQQPDRNPTKETTVPPESDLERAARDRRLENRRRLMAEAKLKRRGLRSLATQLTERGHHEQAAVVQRAIAAVEVVPR